jgi:hypothetical protein
LQTWIFCFFFFFVDIKKKKKKKTIFCLMHSSRSGEDNGSGGSASGSAPASGVDASIVALPYWSAFFGNAGTLALNPCGGIQNLHNDCPVDARGDPTNSFVQLRSAPAAGRRQRRAPRRALRGLGHCGVDAL